MTDLDVKTVDDIVGRLGGGRENLIAMLQAIQGHYRYLPQEALRRLSEISGIASAEIVGVATFYTQFRHRPMGRHLIRVCHGTACHVKGSQRVTDALERLLKLPPCGDTDPEGLFTIEKVACLGCCTLAPVVQIDNVTYGHLTPEKLPRMLRDFLAGQAAQGNLRKTASVAAAEQTRAEIRIGLGSCCVARGSADVYKAFEDALAATRAPATLKTVGCVGMCHQTPLVEIVLPDGRNFRYAQVRAEDAAAILRRHFKPKGVFRRVAAAASAVLDKLLTDEAWDGPERYALDVRDGRVSAFLGPQKHIATQCRGELGPVDLAEYRRGGGFAALESLLRDGDGAAVVDAICRSGLRGRGGAGYLTGHKWRAVQEAPGGEKYVVCNGDEGDPGAFMDRMLLESYPYRVLEGLAIAALAVGACQGVLYIRAEYPLAVRRVNEALKQMQAAWLLGEGILGSDFRLQLRVMEGAGAFVCGEETALLASIEGRRGMPRLRPPYPSQQGLWGRPTLVNNVETFAMVPWILRHGPEQFAAIGTAHSKGTKVFALAGKVARGGLIEVPMGVTIRQVVEDIGGGVAGGRTFKAVQIGGPSGGCIPASLADTPIDYEALHALGAIMGSGGLVVLDDGDCMVEIARYFLQFTQDQSCGKCTFCRIGTRRMLEMLTRICDGRGREGDLERLEALAHQVKTGSLCGLGKTAPNPVLSTLKYFRQEYEAHLAGRCPAGRCKALIRYSITADCIGCTRCAQRCPAGAIAIRPHQRHEIDSAKCIRCDCCREVCPSKAVKVE